jgi:hypothetical protein
LIREPTRVTAPELAALIAEMEKRLGGALIGRSSAQLEQARFFTLERSDEVLSRLTIQLLGNLVANDRSRFATFAAERLFRPTGDDLFYPGQLGRQRLTPGGTLPVAALILQRQLQLGTLGFGFYFRSVDSRLQLQQFQLCVS